MKADLFIDDRNVGGLPDWGVIYEMVHNKWRYDRYLREIHREAEPEKVSFWGRLFGGNKKQFAMSVASKSKAGCCGCNACAEICPKHCINMVKDAKGFLYPKVDTASCNNCGLCIKCCPWEKNNVTFHAPLKAFAAWNRNHDEYLASSSGGAAHVLSLHILSLGGVVYGCTSDDMKIRHIRVTKQEELYKLQGSKYVQSDVCGLYKQVKTDLKASIPVLFIGTPCQVAGLKNYIKNIPEHLFLVDLICHGVPSQQMLHEHISRIAKGRTAERLSFRKGQTFRMEIRGTSMRYGVAKPWHYACEPHKDMYYRAFLNGISYRESCYHCKFAQPERVGDITIGDFWGLQEREKFPPETKEGISVLLPSSIKGLQLIFSIKSALHITERSISEAIKGNTQLRRSSIQGRRSRLFGLLYPMVSFDMAMNIVVADYMAIRKVKDFIHNLRYVRSR